MSYHHHYSPIDIQPINIKKNLVVSRISKKPHREYIGKSINLHNSIDPFNRNFLHSINQKNPSSQFFAWNVEQQICTAKMTAIPEHLVSGPKDNVNYPLTVQYCGHCSMPLEVNTNKLLKYLSTHYQATHKKNQFNQ